MNEILAFLNGLYRYQLKIVNRINIGYYLRWPSEVEAYLRERKAQAEVVRDQNETRFDPQGVRDRLLARRTSKRQ